MDSRSLSDFPRFGRRRLLRLTALSGAMTLLTSCATAPAPAPAPSAPTVTTKAAGPQTPEVSAKPTVEAPRPTAVPATTPAPSITPVKVRFGFTRAIFDGAYLLGAHEAGVYKDRGIDLEFAFLQDDITITKMIISGELQAAEMSPGGPLASIEQGSPVKIVGITYARLPFVMLARKDIKTFKDLEGKSLGTAAQGALTQQIQLALLRKEGIDSSRVNFVSIGPTPEVVRALVGGKVDAGMGLFGDEFALKDNPDIHVIADVSQTFPDLVRFGLPIRQDQIETNDAMVRRFVVAHSAAWRWALVNREAVVQAAVKHLGMSETVAAAAYDAPLTRPGMITPDFTVTPAQMAAIQEMNVSGGRQTKILPFEQVADLRYVQAIAAELGPAKVPVKK